MKALKTLQNNMTKSMNNRLPIEDILTDNRQKMYLIISNNTFNFEVTNN